MKAKFGKVEATKYGWDIFCKNIPLLLLVTGTLFLINYGPSVVPGVEQNQNGIFSPIVTVIFWILGIIVSMGLIKISLMLHDSKKPIYKDLFLYDPEYFWRYVATTFLAGFIIIGGLILLIIPGIIFAVRLKFAGYLVIDKKMNPFEAIKESWKITKGSAWNILLFELLVLLLNIAGILALVAGLLVTIPLTTLASVYVYKKLETK